MSGEVIAFSDMFDYYIALSNDLSKVRKRTHVQLLTDRKSLFVFISKGSRTSEKGMMANFVAAKERFKE